MNDLAKNKKKRKLKSSEEKQKRVKTHRFEASEKAKEVEESEETAEFGRPWSHLQLILSIQNKQIEVQKKVELAFDYVNSRVKGRGDEIDDEDYETVKVSRLIVFLNDWIQSLLTPTMKKHKGAEKIMIGDVEACLDYRCWVIFKFCLEESLKLQVSLSFLRNLLGAISPVAGSALSKLKEASLHSKELSFTDEEFELYSVVLDCFSLIFLSHSGLSNKNLDLWISTVHAVLQLVLKVYDDNIEGANVSVFCLRFSCLVLEPFAKFLKVHPTQRNGFEKFVNELLEPLLHLLGVLHLRFDRNNPGLTGNLLIMVKEVLSQGLFHPANVDGFLSLRRTENYAASSDGKKKDLKLVIQSYHRHLFHKLKSIMAAKKKFALGGLGQLFHLLVHQVKKHKVASLLSEETKMAGETGHSKHLSNHTSKTSSQSGTAPAENSYCPSDLNAEKRRSLFDFFVQIAEPFFLQMNSYLQTGLVVGPMLLDVHCTLKSINSLIARFLDDKLYIKTEDISEGASLNFLKNVYSTILSFATNLLCLPTYDVNKGMQEILILLARELLLALGYFLDIEYEVIENDLTSLWLVILSYLAFGHSFKDTPDQSSLASQVLALGCQLVKLYSELRQVESAIFAFCKAIRLIGANNNDDDCKLRYVRFWSHSASLPYEAYTKSLGMFLSAQEFKIAICEGIKSIPEGQASECIWQLSVDLSESIEWMRNSGAVADGKEFNESNAGSCSLLCSDMQAELFGRALSEIYGLVLDSITVTAGNSSLLGRSIKELMTAIRPCMSCLVALQPDSVNDFISSIMGFDKRLCANKHDMLKFGSSTQWAFVFFFRLYMSTRSLFRQAISLMPPGVSKKMSAAIGDSFAAYSGMDWMDRTDWTNEGYFCLIVQPPASLLDVIQSVSGSCPQGHIADCSPLAYVMNAMAFQRLVDLNRQIKTLEYLIQNNECIIQTKTHDDTGLSMYHKRSKKWGKHISTMKQEAAGLTEFIMSYVPLLSNDERPFYASDDATCIDTLDQALNKSDKWVLGVCSVNKKSLPTVIWWSICQNIDIWSIHATKKKLKMFLSCVIHSSLLSMTTSVAEMGKHHMSKADPLTKITMQEISSELLADSIFYEHKFVRRHLASRFCHLLEKSALPLFNNLSPGEVDLNSSPNWQEVLSFLANSSMVVSGSKPTANQKILNELHVDISRESAVINGLLQFLCWMPKGYMNLKSFSRYVTCILNLERLLIGGLMKQQDALCSHMQYELLRLLLSCRRALRYIIMAYCEEKTGTTQSKLIPVLDSSSSVLWLLKSVSEVVGLQETVSEDCADRVGEIASSLMDHTSYIFLTLSKYLYSRVVHSIVAGKLNKDQPSSSVVQGFNSSNKSSPSLDFQKDSEAWKSVLLIAEILNEQTQGFAISLKKGRDVVEVNLNKLSCMVSCFSGFLWGLASALNHKNETEGDYKVMRGKCEPVFKLNGCINMFSDYVRSVLHILFGVVNNQSGSSYDNPSFLKTEGRSDSLGSEEFQGSAETDILNGERHHKTGAETSHSVSSDIGEDARNASVNKHSSPFENMDSVASVLSKLDSYELQSLNNSLMQRILNGDRPKATILIRQLLIASSAILKLNLQTSNISFSSFIPRFFDISQFLLLKFVDLAEVPQPLHFVWLDGALKFLEELGSHFPSTNPTLTRNLYVKLIDLHLKALGKCISLQGKAATLTSHETESSTKMLHGCIGSSEAFLSHSSYCLDELKARLRMSFKVLIRKPSELHLLSAIQAIERALVGAHEVYTVVYEITSGSADGGKVSSTVAAGIDCLDIILECVSGRKRLNVVKRHIQSVIAALFNIILHLQSPLIFYGTSAGSKGDDGPDPGAVILMCVELLTKVSGKHGLFQMDSWHVAQSLRIPAALFRHLGHLRLTAGPVLSSLALFSDNKHCDCMLGKNLFILNRQFSIDLFAGCCRLLCTNLKHCKSETEQCIAILQESASVLLHCLETVQTDSVTRKGHNFSLVIQEGVKCACFLRRIYEELRQQKDVYGQHCYKFLSNYIWVYSGYGPLKTGIRREIDEALRPGVYALIDVCSEDDLQFLLSEFGEGPCGNTLKTLRHDHKLNFHYEGKV